MSPRVAVVVPCKNEEATIERCLAALKAQLPAPDSVVVVDNGSTDGSLDVARRLADVVVQKHEGTIGALRNAGVSAAPEVDVIGFVDADCEVEPGWLQAGLDALRHADVVGSRTLAAPDASWVAASWAAVEAGTAHSSSGIWTQHMLIKQAIFEALGGFDVGLPTGEDSDLSTRAVRYGARLALVPTMRAVHHGLPSSLRDFIRRERWHTREPGWFLRMSHRSRCLVGLTSLWTLAGLYAGVLDVRRRRGTAGATWTALTAAAVPSLGRVAGGPPGHRWRDGFMLGLWASVRATRLSREIFYFVASRADSRHGSS